MKIMNVKLLLLFFLCGLVYLNAQSFIEDKIVARVGSNNISSKEFLYRYELTPQLFRENTNIKRELKKEFIYSLIAEKLLAQYAVDTALDTIKTVRNTVKNYERMFVRDALYKKEIESKGAVEVDSLLDIYLSEKSNLTLFYLTFTDEKQAKDVYKHLIEGKDFDSLYSYLSDELKDTLLIKRGQLDKEIEETIFSLSINSVSYPLKFANEWYIVKLISGFNPVLDKSKGWETEYKYLQKVAKERIEHKYYVSYMLDFFRDVNVQANTILMKSLAREIYNILRNKVEGENSPGRIYLENLDLLKIKKNLDPDTLSMVYIKFPEKEILLEKFIEFFHYEPFFTDTLDYRKLLGILNGKTKKYIEYELLTEEGFQQGLQNSDEVKENLKMWRENYYSQLIVNEFMDSINVSETDLKTYMKLTNRGNYRIKKVNIIELFVDKLEIAEQILTKLNSGETLEHLAKLYSPESDDEHFESGYFPVTSRGEIGQAADKMKIGDVYGPIRTNNSYVIFKLIGIEEDSIKNNENTGGIDEDIQRELKLKKSRESLNQFIAELANKYGYSINEEWLDKIGVTSSSSLIYNYLGFGGRILAVPLLTPNMEWVKYWKNIQINP